MMLGGRLAEKEGESERESVCVCVCGACGGLVISDAELGGIAGGRHDHSPVA